MTESTSSDNDKRIQIKKDNKNSQTPGVDENSHLFNSPILATKYAHEASKLVYSIEKNFYVIICIISSLFILSLLDFLQVRGIFTISIDFVITIFSAISIAILSYTIPNIIKSKRILRSWADMFERNCIRAGLDISMINRGKEEAIHAIAETIEEVGEPLRKYISSKNNFNEFLNVSYKSIDKANADRILFDVLIDSEQVVRVENNDTDDIITSLQDTLNDYGAIIIKIIDGTVTKDIVKSFFNDIKSYKLASKNKVHLAIIIGEDVPEDSSELAMKLERKGLIYFVLVEKPSPLHVEHPA
ncbi:MAG TPA: hypothetical protein VH796_00450 [Nitrososphaeraceae archaeon]|jgi:hypothetical protein